MKFTQGLQETEGVTRTPGKDIFPWKFYSHFKSLSFQSGVELFKNVQ